MKMVEEDVTRNEQTSSNGEPNRRAQMSIESIFNTKRCDEMIASVFIWLYAPFAILSLTVRVFVGFHTFVVACVLRKTTALRSLVLRVMCAILGIVVVNQGKRDESARVLVANHISTLDHTAIDIVTPCLLPSIWDIPSVVRWCFGYVDLGASRGREELVRRAKDLLSTGNLPILAFPEGIITSGQTALLKFNSWGFEISDCVQPIAVQATRPKLWNINVSKIGASWWADLVFFFALPFTIINITYLPKVQRRDDESVEEFAERVAKIIAQQLGIEVSPYDTSEASEAIKLWKKNRELQKKRDAKDNRQKGDSMRLVNPKQMDDAAMRIKQSHPTYHLADIRMDLEKTRNQATTLRNLKEGRIMKQDGDEVTKGLNSNSWREVYETRKWNMIEINRSKYLNRDL